MDDAVQLARGQEDNWIGETVSGRWAPPEGPSICAEELCTSCASPGSETDTSGGQTREPSLSELEYARGTKSSVVKMWLEVDGSV